MTVRPLGDKTIVKRAEAADRTDSGIFPPESAKDKPKEGKIVALGNGILNRETGRLLALHGQERRRRALLLPTPAPKSKSMAKTSSS